MEAAISDLGRLGASEAQRMLVRLVWLADNSHQVRHKALEGAFQGEFSFRVGDYRAIYTLDHAERRVVIRAIDHRSRSYRRR